MEYYGSDKVLYDVEFEPTVNRSKEGLGDRLNHYAIRTVNPIVSITLLE